MKSREASRFRAVPDIAGYFSGIWRLNRRILDLRQGLLGRLVGSAGFQHGSAGLEYRESGRLVFGDYRGQATQRHDWLLGMPGKMDIYFADGRLFHTADLSSGCAFVRHDCGEDRYLGRYIIRHEGAWSLGWRVTGPRKDMMIVSRFHRA